MRHHRADDLLQEKAVDPEATKLAMREQQTEAQRRKQRANERRNKAIERRKAKAAEVQVLEAAAKAAQVRRAAPAWAFNVAVCSQQTAQELLVAWTVHRLPCTWHNT